MRSLHGLTRLARGSLNPAPPVDPWERPWRAPPPRAPAAPQSQVRQSTCPDRVHHQTPHLLTLVTAAASNSQATPPPRGRLRLLVLFVPASAPVRPDAACRLRRHRIRSYPSPRRQGALHTGAWTELGGEFKGGACRLLTTCGAALQPCHEQAPARSKALPSERRQTLGDRFPGSLGPGPGSSVNSAPESGRRRAQGPRCPPPQGRRRATGRAVEPTRRLCDWGLHLTDPRRFPVPAPARSPSPAGTAALTSSRKPAVSRARTRFKPARPRPRRAPPACASSRAALARAGHTWAGPPEGALHAPPRPAAS